MNKSCTVCGETKPETAFVMDRRRNQRRSQCLPCTSARAKEWRKRNPNYEKDRYQADKVQTRERHLVRKYGVTLDDYNRMLKAQNGCCAICGAAESEQFKSVFQVDHCHATGAVRGLLCRKCNFVLGYLDDEPAKLARAIDYLESSPRSQKPSDEQS
jgi:hypothetical protein